MYICGTVIIWLEIPEEFFRPRLRDGSDPLLVLILMRISHWYQFRFSNVNAERMKSKVKAALLSVIAIWTVLAAMVACQSGPGPVKATLEVASDRDPNAFVSGTVTYRERLALTPGATLIVELRDISYAGGPCSAYRSPDHLQPRSSPHQVQGRIQS